MKKIISIILSLYIVVAVGCIMSGCGNDEVLKRIDNLQAELQAQDELQNKINDFQNQLEEMNNRLAEMEDQIEQLKKGHQYLGNEMQNYVLKISTDKQVYRIGEEILIDIVLENYSGEDVEIAYFLLFLPDSSTGQFPEYELPPVTTKKIFENGENIHMTDRLGGCFSVGQHKLKYRAIFYLNWEMTEFGWESTDEAVEVWSNTIDISIIK